MYTEYIACTLMNSIFQHHSEIAVTNSLLLPAQRYRQIKLQPEEESLHLLEVGIWFWREKECLFV